MEIIPKKNRMSEAKKKFFDSYEIGSEINKKATAESFGVSVVTIYNWINEIETI